MKKLTVWFKDGEKHDYSVMDIFVDKNYSGSRYTLLLDDLAKVSFESSDVVAMQWC